MTPRGPAHPAAVAGQRVFEDGAVTPVIDRTYAFAEIPEAVAYQEQGHAAGKVVVTI